MNTKSILIFIGLFIIIGGIFYAIFGMRETEPGIDGGSLPLGNGAPPISAPPSSQDTISIKTRGTETISVKNFYKNAEEITEEGDVVIADTSDYILMYFPKDQGFIIRLNNPDVGRARAAAENAFLVFLDVTKDQACNIRVSVTVPLAINATYGGKDYGLSFCPWGTPF